jgi:hypothetical protein
LLLRKFCSMEHNLREGVKGRRGEGGIEGWRDGGMEGWRDGERCECGVLGVFNHRVHRGSKEVYTEITEQSGIEYDSLWLIKLCIYQ